MLELRPNCEYCDADLPVDSEKARICTYECTFCEDCVRDRLYNVCPNCGGGFVPRPIRPAVAHRENTSREFQHPSTVRRYLNFSVEEVADFVHRIKHLEPQDR